MSLDSWRIFGRQNVSLEPPLVAVHGQRCVLHHVVHRKVLQPAELRSVVSPAQFEEEEQSNDDGSDDEG